jgi:hypothetical protein
VTDESAPKLDPAEVFGAFARNEVEFIAVGGFAALRHGSQRTTKDIDPLRQMVDRKPRARRSGTT